MLVNNYITVNRLLIITTVLLLVILMTVGIFLPGSFLMRFADPSLEYAAVRVVIACVLIGLLLSHPPRSISFRILLGILSISLPATSIGLFSIYEMSVVDVIVFLEVGIIFAVEALEVKQPARSQQQFMIVRQ